MKKGIRYCACGRPIVTSQADMCSVCRLRKYSDRFCGGILRLMETEIYIAGYKDSLDSVKEYVKEQKNINVLKGIIIGTAIAHIALFLGGLL